MPARSLATMAPAIVTWLVLIAVASAALLALAFNSRVQAVYRLLETQAAITSLLSGVQDAETGQRGYLLTGEPRYLSPYRRATAALPKLIEGVRSHVVEDSHQLSRLLRVRTRIAKKLRELEGTVALRRAGNSSAALAAVRTGQGLAEMEEIRTALATMETFAVASSEQKQEAARRAIWSTLSVLTLTLAAIPLLLRRVSGNIRAFIARNASTLEWRKSETERLGREAILRATELRGVSDRFELVLDAATDFGIVLTDPNGVVTRWSRGAEVIFGWSAQYAEGRHSSFFFTPEDNEDSVAAKEMAEALASGAGREGRWQLRADGSRFWASGELQPVLDPAGALSGFVKILRDGTEERLASEAERRRANTLAERVDAQAVELESAYSEKRNEEQRREAAEGQVRQLQRLEGLGQLTAGIAHDFNNMLAVVIGSLSILRRRLGSGQDAPDLLRLVSSAEEGADRAAELTRRLLAFSRQQALQPAVLGLNSLVGGMSELLRRTLGERIRVEAVLAGGLWKVNADPHEIERVLLNLAVNARDAMPGGGVLTLETSNSHLDDEYAAAHAEVRAGQYVLLSVTDSGTGMDASVLSHAFDPFFTTKPAGSGTGLGLSQAYGFAKQSKGHLKIYSEVGHGTTVKLYLPRWFGSDRPSTQYARQNPADSHRGHLTEIVLVVEDQERVRTMSVEALRELGYTVRHASGGAEALEVLASLPSVALLFTDVVMPGMTGKELADQAVARYPGLRVLFTTGYTRNAVVHNGVLDAGVALLTKPFTVTQLAAKVRATIDEGGANR